MNWIVTGGISAFAIIAALPAFVVGGGPWRRLIIYAAMLALGAGVWFVGWRWFGDWGPLVYAAMAVVPLATTGVLLLQRAGRPRKTGVAILVALVSLIAYSVTAARMSHAMLPYDGVTDLPSYLSGQSWVRDSLNDPESARFKDLFFNKYEGKWFMCGQVNARNRMGGLVGYTRFYVPWSDYLHQTTFNQDSDGFDDYLRHCYGGTWNDRG